MYRTVNVHIHQSHQLDVFAFPRCNSRAIVRAMDATAGRIDHSDYRTSIVRFSKASKSYDF